MKLRAAAVVGALLVGAVALPARGHSGADRRPGATQFDLEVQITRPNQPGHDPRIVADRYGNLFTVARKVTPASPDDRLQTAARTSSWRWTSADGGATWQALSGVPAEVDARAPGDLTDVAVDDASHVYVVDGPSLLRYTATALGSVRFDGAGVVPAARPTALAANGDGSVFVLAGNALYASYDGGQTFGPQGHAFAGATDCRIATGPAKAVYASCLDADDKVLLFASKDDGRTFARSVIASASEVPPVAVTPDGTVYVLRAETGTRTNLYLMRSADRGRTWTQRRATDEPYLMAHVSLTSSADGRLGAAMYVSSEEGDRWFVAGGMFRPGEMLLVVNFADHTPVAGLGAAPPEGAPSVSFLPQSRLAMAWTIVTTTMPDGLTPLLRDVWFVRSQVPGTVDNTPDLARTPRYEIPPCTVQGQVRAIADWQQLRSPEFDTREGGAGQDLEAYAVDPYEPRILYATNGTTLMRSDDGGCRWREVWSLEPSPSESRPVSAATGRVVAIAVPEDRREHATVFAVIAEANRTRVVRSPNGEPGTFELRDSGLPPTGAPGLFRVAAANPDFLYLTIGNLLYASEDAGESWSLRTAPADVPGAQRITALALDPRGPNNLYAVWSGALHHSRDGGRTWTAPTAPAGMQDAAGEITAVDVFHGEGAVPPMPTAWSAPAGSKPATVLRSRDDGVTWTTEKATGLQGRVESAVHGSGADILVVSTLPANGGDAEVYRRDLKTKAYVALSPVDTTAPFRVSADRRGHPTYYGMGPRALYRYAGDAIEPPPGPDAIDDSVFGDIRPPARAPLVRPVRQNVTLLVGERATVPFTVDLAPRKPRLDVMVVSDTSESMAPHLPALRRDLIAALRRLGKDVDLRVGVAQAKTDAAPPVYRRERDIGPLDEGFAAAFDRLEAVGAGLETQLIGLDQLVSGRGMGACPATSSVGQNGGCLAPPVGTLCEVNPDTAGCAVRPGQQAHFRDGAVAVVVHATDTTFRNPEGTPRRPDGRIDIPAVARKYVDAGVLHVGLAADPEGLEDLRIMSALTGTVAPRGGLDCTGDGVADVAAGKPAVCTGARHLDGVLRSLARTRTPATHVHVGPAAESRVLTGVTPGDVDGVDRTVARRLAVRVAVSCDEVVPGHYDVLLRAQAHDEPATTFGVGLECVLPVEEPRAPRPGVAAIPPVVLPPIPVAPPVNPLPNVNPNAQPQVQVNAQAQPQAAIAQQERHQAELALAENDMQGDEVPAPLVMLAGMIGASAAAAHMLQRRTQAATSTVRNRRRR